MTLRTWRAKGVGPPYIKVGRNAKYRAVDVAKWLAANTRTSKKG